MLPRQTVSMLSVAQIVPHKMRKRETLNEKPIRCLAALVKNEKLHTCIHVIARLQCVQCAPRDKCTNVSSSSSSAILCCCYLFCEREIARNEHTKKREENVVKLGIRVAHTDTRANTRIVCSWTRGAETMDKTVGEKKGIYAVRWVYCCCCWLLFVDASMGHVCVCECIRWNVVP